MFRFITRKNFLNVKRSYTQNVRLLKEALEEKQNDPVIYSLAYKSSNEKYNKSYTDHNTNHNNKNNNNNNNNNTHEYEQIHPKVYTALLSGFIGGMCWSIFDDLMSFEIFLESPLTSLFWASIYGFITSFGTAIVIWFLPGELITLIPLSIGISVSYHIGNLCYEYHKFNQKKFDN